MAYLGAIDLVVSKTLSILTIKRLPSAQVVTGDTNTANAEIETYLNTLGTKTLKYDSVNGDLTSILTIANVQTYYSKSFTNVSVTSVPSPVISGTSAITTGQYGSIKVGGPSVNWNTNTGSLGVFLTNSVVSINLSASTNTGGTISYSVTVGALPVNLSLSPSTGAITGVINNTVTSNTIYTFTVTATESISSATSDQVFTITESVKDPYFNYVTLLLNSEISSSTSKNINGTFLDSSNSSLALVPITKGAVTQGSFGPFNTVNENGWSNFFTRANSDSLLIAGNTVFNFQGSSNFTCEAWIFMNTMPVAGDSWPTNFTNNFVVMECGSASVGDGFACIIGATKMFVQNSDTLYGTATHSMTTNTWYHVAWVRINGTLYFYVNGTQIGSVAFGVNIGTGANTYIGSETGQGAYFDGYISNIRVIKNQALYTGAFTPATAPLTSTTVGTSGANVAASITGTVSLLMSQNRRFIDNSGNNNTISVITGSPRAAPFSAFTHSRYYTPSTSGVSAYFTGTTGDYLVMASDLTNAAGYDKLVNWYSQQYYSIECWINPLGYAVSGQSPILIGNMDPAAATNYWSFGLWTNGVLRFKYFNGGEVTVTTTNTVSLGTWSHIALAKVGLNILLYINGVLSTTAVISGTPQWNLSYPLTIGQYNTVSWNGYVYNLRVTNTSLSATNPFNFLVYPNAFTPATAALSAPNTLVGGGTQLLTVQSSTFIDNSPNAYTVSNGIIPFTGTYSYLFDGANKFLNLSAPSTYATALATPNNFTIEMWIYAGTWVGSPTFIDFRPLTTNGVYIKLSAAGSGQIILTTSSTVRITTVFPVPIMTWTHIALVRNSSVTTIYINGIPDGNTYADTNSYLVGTSRPIIGIDGFSATSYFQGAISNLRITSGALYTTQFTPPTTQLTTTVSVGTVLLLTARDTTIVDNSVNNGGSGWPITGSLSPNAVVESGSLVLGNSIIPFDGTYSATLTGTQLASVNYSSNYNLTDEFTIEFWLNFTSHTSGAGILSFGNAWQITWNAATNALKFEGNNAAITLTSATTLAASTWYHVALVRAGIIMRFYFNGTADATTTNQSIAFTAVGSTLTPSLVIGADKTLSLFTTGYISNIRFVNRRAVYLQNFATPTAALTSLSNTGGIQVLTAQSSTVTDNSGNSIVVQPTGFAITNSAIPFADTYSYTFNGSNSNITVPGATALDLTGNFTIEFWFNLNYTGATSSSQILNRGGGLNIAYASYEILVINGGLYFAASSANTSYDIGGEGTAPGLIGLFIPNTWNHVAITRSGNTYRGFLNGVQGYFQILALTPYTVGTARGLSIGSNYQTTWGVPANIVQNIPGYMSNLRIVKGNSLYNANFTPSTTALTNVSGTSLLTLQSATLIDNSSFNQPITASGYSFNPNITPFSNTVSTGFQNNTNFTGNLPVALNTSNFTLDFWSYPQSLTNNSFPGIFDIRTSGSDTAGFGVYISGANLVLRIGGTSNNIIATSGSLLPFANTYSWAFSGTTQYVTIPATSVLEFGANNFTIEFWWFPLATGRQALYHGSFGTDWSVGIDYNATGTNRIGIWASSNGTSWNLINADTGGNGVGSIIPTQNTWCHVAYVRNGTTWSLFVNGSASVNITGLSGTIVNRSASTKVIGCWFSTASIPQASGYISNFRIVNSAALYTGTFTPPTTALTNTVSSVPYMTSSTYYGVFNGSNQYLTIPANAGFSFGTGDFTVECWVWTAPYSNTYGRTIIDARPLGTNGPYWSIGMGGDGGGAGFTTMSSGGVTIGGGTVGNSAWHHLAATRQSGTLRFFVDGNSVATPITGNTDNISSGDLRVGFNSFGTVGGFAAETLWNGYISNLRIVKGGALYTTNFTPSGPLTTSVSSGTVSMLILQSVSATTDTAGVSTFSNPTSITTVNSFYGGSSLLTLQSATLIDNSTGNGGVGFTLTNSASPITLNVPTNFYGTYQWNHVALVKNNGQIFCYLNGTLKATVADTSTFSNTKFFVGSTFDTYYFQGYINNLRLVTGIPLIGSTLLPNSVPFIPSTAELTTTSQGVTASTVTLLTAKSATIVDNSISPVTLTNSTSNVTVTTAYIPFAGAYSYYFNGTTQYLTGTTGAAFQFPGDFTIECWVYSITGVGQTNYSTIIDTRTSNIAFSTAIALNLTPTGYLNFYINGVNYTSNSLLGANSWTYVALVRSGSIITLFQNGIPVATAVNVGFNLSNGNCWIGTIAGALATSFWNGYISNLRIVKGSAVYTVLSPSFTPGTTNNSITASTVQLLTAQSATIVDNSINGLALTNANTVTAGNTIIPFAGTYSLQFNGTNYLTTATSATAFNMLDFDFTIEAWVYLTSYNYSNPAVVLTAQSLNIVDNSINKFLITNNNNVGVSTSIIPFANTYSNSFNGTNQTLYIPSNNAFAFGVADFTVEAWVYIIALGTHSSIAQVDPVGSSAVDKWYFSYTGSTLRFFTHASATCGITIPWTPSLSTWYHVAVVRYNGNFLAFINGVQGVGTITGTPSTYGFGQNGLTIGAISSPFYLNGYISNFRIVKGTALYTGTFVPSTTPLTALISNNIGNVIVSTTNGAPAGYSLWITPDGSAINFTVNSPSYYISTVSATTAQLILKTWYHIAVTRQGSTINIWRNGISVASASGYTVISYPSPNNVLYIGYFNDGTYTRYFNGYISNLRVSRGISLYSSTFNPLTVPLTVSNNPSIPSYIANNFYIPPTPNTNNTLLLLAQAASVSDSSVYSVPLLPSNATPASINTVIPYSNTYSFDFQGAPAQTYLSIPPNSNFDLAYNGVTIEFWIFPRFFDTLDGTIISAGNNLAGATWRLTGNISGALSFIGTVTVTTANNAFNFNTWSHIAIVRFNYVYSIFVNGVNKASGWNTTLSGTLGKYLYIGYGYSTTNKYQSFLISNVRIVSGVTSNVYIKSFTPPTSNLTAIPNTIFLLGNTQGFGVSSAYGYTPSIAVNNYPSAVPVSNITPFPNTYSWSFNGNSYISWPGVALGSGAYTVELWFYNTTTTWSNPGLVGTISGNTNSFFIHIISQTLITTGQYGVGNLFFTVAPMIQNTWYHVAAVRDGNNNTTLFLNGIRSSVVINTYNHTGLTNGIGALSTVSNFTGYISNVRISYGPDSALYDTGSTYVTIPSVPLGVLPATQLLTLQDYSLIDNSANNSFLINQASGPMISRFAPFANTYSVHFSGSGNYNYLIAATNSLTQFEARDFTIECWCYFNNATATANYQVIYSNYSTWGTDGLWWGKHTTYSGYVCFFIYNSYAIIGSIPILQETSFPPNKTWVHYAVVRIGNTFTMYRNGVATVTSINQYTGIVSAKMDPIYIGIEAGALANTTTNFNGYISNFRIVNRLGVYTGTFTPPTTPLQRTQSSGTNISAISAGQTVFLTCQSETFIDNSESNLFMWTQPSSFVSTNSVVPFSGAYSIATYQFNSAWLVSTTYTGTQLSLSGFPLTVECWFYVIASTGSNQILITTSNWYIAVGSAVNTFIWLTSLTTLTIPYNFNLGTWYHAAWTYDTVSHRIYINGLVIGAYNSSAAWTEGTQVWIGSGAGNSYLHGYISNVRIVKGSVVYAHPSFTPASTALTTAANSTVLLTAQSATFVDNSQMNWYIVNAGAGLFTTTNSTIPFSSTYSYIFNGVNNMLSIPTGSSNSLELQDDFTIEFWFYSNITYGTTTPTSGVLISKNGGLNIAWSSYLITLYGNSIYFAASSNNNGYDIGGHPYDWPNAISSSGVGLLGTYSINTWYHIAIVRSSGIYKGYRNGINTWTQGGMNPYSNTIRGLTIGGTYGGPLAYTNYNPGLNVVTNAPTWGGNHSSTTANTYGFFNGYISNIRINNGIAMYTENFTPPSATLTPVTSNAYTALLTAQSSTAIDNSVNPKYILGGPTYTTNSLIPFANTYSYSLLGTADNGAASGFMVVYSPGPIALTTSTTPFTIEMWLYPVIRPTGNTIISEHWTGSNNINMAIGFAAYNSTGDLGLASSTGDRIAIGYYTGSAWVMTPPTTTLEMFKWTHVAGVFDGTTTSLYLNGVLNGTITSGWSSAVQDGSLYIGRRWDLAGQYNNSFQGFISNFRMVKGQALYTNNFTPPTTAVTAIANTQMLLNFDNASIYDATAKNDLITYGNPAPILSSSIVKYGTSSMYFNRLVTAPYLIIPATNNLVFTGDFTIECWVYLTSMPASNVYPEPYWIFGTGAAATAAGTDLFIGSTLLNFNLTTTATPEISIAHGISVNDWYHVAICRSGTNLRAYVGGVLKQTATSSTASSISGYNVVIGRADIAGSANTSGGFNGYIDELRITKYARYTTTPFTPPTGPSPIG